MTYDQAKMLATASLGFCEAVARVAGDPSLLDDQRAATDWYLAHIGDVADAFIAHREATTPVPCDALGWPGA